MQHELLLLGLNFRDGGFLQIDVRAISIRHHHSAEELAEVGIVPDQHQRFELGILAQHLPEMLVLRFWPERVLDVQLSFVTDLIRNQ